MSGKPRDVRARTILVADDDPQLLTLVSQRLRRRGANTAAASWLLQM